MIPGEWPTISLHISFHHMLNSEIIIVDTGLHSSTDSSQSPAEPQGWEIRLCSEGESRVGCWGSFQNIYYSLQAWPKKLTHWPKICFLLSVYVLSTSFICKGSDGLGRCLVSHELAGVSSLFQLQRTGKCLSLGVWGAFLFIEAVFKVPRFSFYF